jgi:hypothetical protein
MAAQEHAKPQAETAARYVEPTVCEEARLTAVVGLAKVTDVPS